jgi:hypothetical protein
MPPNTPWHFSHWSTLIIPQGRLKLYVTKSSLKIFFTKHNYYAILQCWNPSQNIFFSMVPLSMKKSWEVPAAHNTSSVFAVIFVYEICGCIPHKRVSNRHCKDTECLTDTGQTLSAQETHWRDVKGKFLNLYISRFDISTFTIDYVQCSTVSSASART